ncbi:MAG TPA: cysteine--tRNA ligase [Syntrophales bacterium]|nr:cysteine--tRNA ligase [Syntrophales bacterium]HOM06753.1 cysteine--tRNA ligase [Syntrophales bacterium]HOO00075.1 cysteine--tRNA ligase [Syntrophales bacterium]HPC01662.1 cysteine--tRNA ligase [Syntrophales bacterium]HPQ06089.1 cysteine--tRNA ligase [Syntrophales bacterium]
MPLFHKDILETIGNTPLVEIRRLNPNPNVRILAKLEYFNPGGSIKDRTAYAMIRGAEERGELTKDKIILEATSGNTGIGLALVAASRGYRLCLTMSEAVSEERKKILRALGAELIFTPSSQGTDGAIEKAYAILRENPDRYYCPDQFNNPDNILAHYHGTGEEIWRQTDGEVTMVVLTLGTTGTAMGVSKRLKEYNPAVIIVGVEPYLQHKIQGLKNMKESYRPGIFDKNRLDEKVNILDEDAFEMARRLAREEGLMVGMSSGAAMHVAAQKARELSGGVIVVVFPDGGERYLSTELYADREETSLRLYNCLSRSKEPFKPLKADEVLIHSCGPTVHEVPHIGGYRRFVVSDLIRRYLIHKGYRVRHLTNIIDLADRSIKGAKRAGLDLKTFSDRCTAAFLRDMEKLNILRDETYPRATENVEDMVKVVERLVEKGYAYEKLRSVYFDISKLEDYGRLSRIDLSNIQHGRTVDLDDYEKDSPGDFTLLKRSTLNELKEGVYFKTPWGNARPSWHLECAAISLKYLGEVFDIHASGSDIVFPHCDNVLAIGKAATGKVMANYWINTELVMVGGKKMSRSLDNVFTIEDLEKRGYQGKEIRFFLLSSHYRKPLNFSFGALDTARNTVRKLNLFIQRLLRCRFGEGYGELDQAIYDVRQGFFGCLDDDLNVSGALASLFAFVNKVSLPLAKDGLSEKDRDKVLDTLKILDSILGVMEFKGYDIDMKAKELIARREAYRREGKWQEADEIRRELRGMGVEISDTPGGTIWRLR